MERTFVNKNLENKICSYFEIKDILNLPTLKAPEIISFVNPFSYKLIAEKPILINEVDYWFVDGILLCYLTNLRREKKIIRASFDLSSVGSTFLKLAEDKSYKIAFVGGAETEINLACNNLKIQFPRLNIVYKHHGYIQKDFEKVYTEINGSGANYLIVGMGTPMQEEFAIGCKKHCTSLSLIFTCGGFLTQTAMKPDYYHPIIKKLGLRWLQRAYLHKHVRSRLLKDYPRFIIRYLLNK